MNRLSSDDVVERGWNHAETFETAKAKLDAEKDAFEAHMAGSQWTPEQIASLNHQVNVGRAAIQEHRDANWRESFVKALKYVQENPDQSFGLPPKTGLPTDPAARKSTPIFSGVLQYFPDALAAVAQVSKLGNDQHNPGQPLHWSKGKSTDHENCAIRHLMDGRHEPIDSDGGRHRAKAAWRALAACQIEIEAEAAGLSYDAYIAKLEEDYAWNDA